MGWESRTRGGRYYTRSYRVNGRVKREYIGKGPFAELLAAQDENERAEQEYEKQKQKEREASMNEVDELVEEFCEATDTLTNAALILSGYHQHKGEWRKRRG